MSYVNGMAWLHAASKYREKFGELPPKWVEDIDLYPRRCLVMSAIQLSWRLPADWLIGAKG